MSYAAAGKSIDAPVLRCPTRLVSLMHRGGYWRWLRAALVIERIWIRRGRCGVCGRTHALLPDLALARRLDEVAIIGRGIALEVMAGFGLRPIAAMNSDLVIAAHMFELQRTVELPRPVARMRATQRHIGVIVMCC